MWMLLRLYRRVISQINQNNLGNNNHAFFNIVTIILSINYLFLKKSSKNQKITVIFRNRTFQTQNELYINIVYYLYDRLLVYYLRQVQRRKRLRIWRRFNTYDKVQDTRFFGMIMNQVALLACKHSTLFIQTNYYYYIYMIIIIVNFNWILIIITILIILCVIRLLISYADYALQHRIYQKLN